jgi:hypothetical protein
LVEAMGRLRELSPKDCRQHAVEALDIGPTVRGYEAVFQDAVDRAPARNGTGRMRVLAPAAGVGR